VVQSGLLAPFPGEGFVSYTIESPLPARSDVTLTINGLYDEQVTVYLNAEFVTHTTDFHSCAYIPMEYVEVIDQDEFNQRVSGGDAYFGMQNTSGGQTCDGAFMAIRVEYAVDPPADCNENLVPDSCDLDEGFSADCNSNGVPDECDEPDCNGNDVPDSCDLEEGTSPDFNGNGVPDECDPDCNGNGFPDFLDIIFETSPDCNGNGVPDECDVIDQTSPDCDANGIPDQCDVADGAVPDCNGNGVPDDCDIEAGTSPDYDFNGIPDECDDDCNDNGIPDFLDVALGFSADCNGNDIPDECEIGDCNANGILDVCELTQVYATQSEALSPIGTEVPKTFVLPAPVIALGDVELSFTASADLSLTTEWIDVDINSVGVGGIFQDDGSDCPVVGDETQLTVPAAVFNDAIDGGLERTIRTTTGSPTTVSVRRISTWTG
jgi:hypothetical protein